MRRYDLPSFGLRLLKGAHNKQIFRVSSPERGNFLLRMYVPPPVKTRVEEPRPITVIHSEAGLHSQMLWLLDLRRTMRLPVPEPVQLADGSLVGNVSVEGVSGSRNFALMRWIPGDLFTSISMENAEGSRSSVFSLGSYIARLHRHAEQYTAPEGFLRPRWDWDYLFGPSSRLWSTGKAVFSEEEMEALRVTAERVRQELQATGETRDAFGMIHRDLHRGNLLHHEGTLYAIDFDHCGWGYYLYDLTMPYMQMAHFGHRCEEMREVFLEGYQRERSLPGNCQKRLEVFVAMRRATGIHSSLSALKGVPLSRVPAQPAWKIVALQKSLKALKGFAAREEPKLRHAATVG